jgi:hypothetical protein
MCSFCIDRLEQQTPHFLPYDEIGLPARINKISLKQWLALFTLLMLYIFLGATFYYYFEGNLEVGTRLQEYSEGLELQGKMNLSIVIVKSRNRSSFVFGLYRQSSETSELIILSKENLHSTLYYYSPFTLTRHTV